MREHVFLLTYFVYTLFIIVDALYVFAFMQLLVETLQDYLGDLSGPTLRDHFDIVYQVAI